ncbi:type II 3-dehydroquinate dehydratase [Rhizosphaericola mali]|uniref:3-dehydroquinate dehydratase n=1 Tax=Rhizosphaericola mali TaxID=2545455 RepID=A0A5P2G729_9BACT|nr:type II 3-dehydroquinate dehydratase [Rhizosphaericola mali]QES89742.1 type II 3-dehydroquinate dehydratase [Rhizosphaericola mali]
MKKIAIINGPNLNLLGVREPEVYGKQSFHDYFQILQSKFPKVELTYFQSNIEGEMINEIQRIGFEYDGIVLNPAAYTHTSIAIMDAIKAITTPLIEVHISNIHTREEFRHHSFISAVAVGTIVGLGLKGYDLAIQYFLSK